MQAAGYSNYGRNLVKIQLKAFHVVQKQNHGYKGVLSYGVTKNRYTEAIQMNDSSWQNQ